MRVEQQEDGSWEIIDTPDGVDTIGPYPTRREAEETLRRVRRALKYDTREFWLGILGHTTDNAS